MVQLWSSFFLVSLPILATAFNTTVHGQVISKRAASNWPIKSGYVAFGDSFAAGMGTGATTTDACRVGTNNLGDLINRYTNNGDVDFQQRACSGDTTVGLNRQIDKWQKPELADVATISMGGNDLHFSDLIWYCVITPFPSKQDEALCDQQITWAKGNMTDTSDNSLAARLQAAYKRVLDKSGGLDIHVYVTGYPKFFNEVDTDCDRTTFYYWKPHHKESGPLGKYRMWLSTEKRKALNDLVLQLNGLISDAIDKTNNAQGRKQVHFVDTNPQFDDQHRWCEAGDFHEPDPGRLDTWFFLSGWSDITVLDDAITTEINVTEEARETMIKTSYINEGKIPLPDADTCASELGTDPDPWAVWMCRISQDIGSDPDSDLATNYRLANAEVAAKELNGQHIPWFVPTRQIKMFHPRSPGMLGYRNAVILSILKNQVNTASDSGKCSMKITEMWTCEAQSTNLYADVSIAAPDGHSIYQTEQSTSSPGQPIDDADPLHLDTSFGPLIITGEHEHDYIQFESGENSWLSGTTTGPATCQLVGDDWNKDGPQNCPSPLISRQFSCEYPCTPSPSSASTSSTAARRKRRYS